MNVCSPNIFQMIVIMDFNMHGAVEFIIYHAEVSMAFVEEKKIPKVYAY